MRVVYQSDGSGKINCVRKGNAHHLSVEDTDAKWQGECKI